MWAGAAMVAATLLACCPALAAGCDKGRFVVALDVGHDRAHPGATSARGEVEFDYNLALSGLVLGALQANGFARAFRIGETGGPITLASRPQRARDGHAAMFISLHHDFVQPHYLSQWSYQGRSLAYSDDFHGYSIFVSTRSPWARQNLVLADDLGRALRARGLAPSLHHAAPEDGERHPLLDRELGIYQYDSLAVLRGATMPALLLELAVIVNRDEEQAIRSGLYHPKMVAAIVEAVTAFCQETAGLAGLGPAR